MILERVNSTFAEPSLRQTGFSQFVNNAFQSTSPASAESKKKTAAAIKDAKDKGYIKDVAKKNFKEDVIEASYKMPVVVDVGAEWCEPCRALTPILEQYTALMNGKVKLAEINFDTKNLDAFPPDVLFETTGSRDPKEVMGFALPIILTYKNGKISEKLVGFDKDKVEALIQNLIKEN